MAPKTLVLLTLLAAGPTVAAAQQPAPHPGQASPPFRVELGGSGRPMILIPGLLSGGEVWQETAAHFGTSYETHVLTLAGFAGVPPTDADPFLATTRDAIIDYIRTKQLERPVLVGHSLGAFVALWVAASAPDLVGPVVAVDGVPFLSALGDTTMTAERASTQAAAARDMFGDMSPEALAAQTRMALAAQTKDTTWLGIGEHWGATSDPATTGRAVAEMMVTDLREDVAAIRTPVLLFMAGNDMEPPVLEQVRRLYSAQLAAVPNGRVAVAENARHFIMLDDPDFLHRTMAEFLAAATEGGR